MSLDIIIYPHHDEIETKAFWDEEPKPSKPLIEGEGEELY